MIQTALQWLYDNLYSYMIPVCALCVLRIAVCLMELGHVRRLREKKCVFRYVGGQYREIGAFTGILIGAVLIQPKPRFVPIIKSHNVQKSPLTIASGDRFA